MQDDIDATCNGPYCMRHITCLDNVLNRNRCLSIDVDLLSINAHAIRDPQPATSDLWCIISLRHHDKC